MSSTGNRLTVCKFQHVVNLYSRHRYFEYPDSPWLIVQILQVCESLRNKLIARQTKSKLNCDHLKITASSD